MNGAGPQSCQRGGWSVVPKDVTPYMQFNEAKAPVLHFSQRVLSYFRLMSEQLPPSVAGLPDEPRGAQLGHVSR